jgi:cytochrome c peroxidase
MTRGPASQTRTPTPTWAAAAPSRRWRSYGTAAVCAVLWVLLAACRKDAPEAGSGSGSNSSPASSPASLAIRPAEPPPVVDPIPPHTVPPLTAREKVGQSIFLDATLSNPAGTSCASCHDPSTAFSGNNGSDSGVARGSRPGHFGRRNAPSVMYLKHVPPFHFALEDDDDVTETPFGGLTWSGRADTVAEFARLPLLDADEMNNGSEAEIARKLRASSYAADLDREFPGALETPASAMKALGEALQAFLTSETMSPFTSKFDDFLRGKAQLSPLEWKGLAAFENRAKGACKICHMMYERSNRPESSLFTTYAYDAVGVPRNRAIAANADPTRYDLGLCERTQERVPSSDEKWCGAFRTPSLRNVAVRQRFMHNGAFSKLRDVVAFYATRSTNPDRWYPHGTPFDDSPDRYRGNVNTLSFPYNRRKGDPPAMDDDAIDAIVAFLQTLTDEPYRGRVANEHAANAELR